MVKIRNLELYSDKIFKDSVCILCISDLHLTENSGEFNLHQIMKSPKIEWENLDYIVLPGDMIDKTNLLESDKFRSKLEQELWRLSRGCRIPTICSLGNHDIIAKDENGKWVLGQPEPLIDIIQNMDNFTFLDNTNIYKDSSTNIAIGAFNPNYHFFHGTRENTAEFEKQFREQYDANKFDSNQYNIFLSHCPQPIIELSSKSDKCIQDHTDLVFSGHMHNGMIPNCLQISGVGRGAMGPQQKFFPKFAYGIYKIGETFIVVNGPVNTIVEVPMLNKFYEPEASVVRVRKK